MRNQNWPVFINFAILVHPSVLLTAVPLFELSCQKRSPSLRLSEF